MLDTLSFYQKYKNLNVYGVSYNETNKLKYDKTIDYFKPKFVLIDNEDLFVKNNNITQFPTFLLLNKENIVIYKQVGFSFDLKEKIEKVINTINIKN